MKHEVCRKLIKAIDAYIAKQDKDIADDLGDAGYEDTDWTMEQAQTLEDNLAAAMNVDTDIIAEQLERSASVEEFVEEDWERYQEASALADDIQEVVYDSLSTTLPKLVTDYLHQTDMGLAANVLRARTVNWMESWSAELGQIMKLNSHQNIGSIIVDALTNGHSVAKATQAIMDSGIRSNYARARQTALTEMLTAHSAAAEEALQQSPAVEEKEWRHTGSRRNKPRKNHVAMDGQIVPKEEPFELEGADGGIYKPMYPRDTTLPASERINCHCIHRGIASAAVLGLPLEERKKLQQQAIDEDDKRWAVDLDEQNKAKAGLGAWGFPINSLLPNANGGILKPTKVMTGGHLKMQGQEPNAVIDRVNAKGGISRYIYDENGNIVCRIDNSDHFQPKDHKVGNGGAHYHRPIVDDNGNVVDFTECRCLTSKMRRLCSDIITEYPDMVLKAEDKQMTEEEFRRSLEEYFEEIVFTYNGEQYLVSNQVKNGPYGKMYGLFRPDGTVDWGWKADDILSMKIGDYQMRAILSDLEF